MRIFLLYYFIIQLLNNFKVIFIQQSMENQKNQYQQSPKPSQNSLKLQLYEMGFNQPKVSQALSLFKNKQQVVNYLLNGNPVSSEQQAMKNEQDQFEDEEEDYKMIFVVRMDLKLALHKIAELTATAALRAYKQIESQIQTHQEKELAFYQWCEGGQRKIVVKSPSDKQLIQLAERAKAANMNFVLVEQLQSNLRYEKAPPPSKKQAKAQKKQMKEEKIQSKQQPQNQSKMQQSKVQPVVDKPILVLGAFGPAAESEIDPLTKHFKLL